MTYQLYPITIMGHIFSLTKEECAELRQQLWDNYSWPLMVEMMGNTRVVVSTVGGKKYYQFVAPTPKPLLEPFPGAFKVAADLSLLGRSIMGMVNQQPEPTKPRDVELFDRPAPLTAADQPMPDHLEPAERDEIDRLLLAVFRQDVDAIAFLTAHNSGLRAKPLDLIQRDRKGVARVLAYLRQAASVTATARSSCSADPTT